MITDWLRAPDVWLLTPLVAAFLCSLVLTLTRPRFPPAKTAWHRSPGVPRLEAGTPQQPLNGRMKVGAEETRGVPCGVRSAFACLQFERPRVLFECEKVAHLPLAK